MRSATYLTVGGIFALGLLGVAPSAHAAIMWTFGTEFSESGGSLSGSVMATIDDGGSPGSVNVAIDTFGLDGSLSEKITGLYLNLNPSLDPNNLVVSFPGDNTDPHATVSLGTDAFKADGDGLYDILISWDQAGVGSFLADEIDTITFALTGLLDGDFFFLSTPDGGKGPFHAALRAQSLGANGSGSGWFFPTGGFDPGDETPVPEPGSFALFGVGLVGLGLAIRRRRARSL